MFNQACNQLLDNVSQDIVSQVGLCDAIKSNFSSSRPRIDGRMNYPADGKLLPFKLLHNCQTSRSILHLLAAEANEARNGVFFTIDL